MAPSAGWKNIRLKGQLFSIDGTPPWGLDYLQKQLPIFHPNPGFCRRGLLVCPQSSFSDVRMGI